MIASPPEAVYPRGWTHRLAALLLSLPLFFLIYSLRDRLDPNWTWGSSLVVLFALALFFRSEAGKVVAIHPEGLVLRSGSSSRDLPWATVRQIRYRAVRAQGGGLLGILLGELFRRFGRAGSVDERTVSIRCALRGEEERPFIVTSAFRGAGEAVTRIFAKVNPRLVEESMERLRSAGEADFGPLRVRPDAILRGERSVAFAEVAACGLDSGRFYVKKKGAWLTPIQVPVAKIPNVFVLLDLLRRLEVPGLRASDLSSATHRG